MIRWLLPAAAGDSITSLYAFHELDRLITTGVNAKVRYDWFDGTTNRKNDHRHRYTLGFELHPVRYLEVIAQYRHNREPNDQPNDEAFIQLHGWF